MAPNPNTSARVAADGAWAHEVAERGAAATVLGLGSVEARAVGARLGSLARVGGLW